MIIDAVTENLLGRCVRNAWIQYCIETGRTERPDHLCTWDEMDEWSKEVDRRIGVAVARYVTSGLIFVTNESGEVLRVQADSLGSSKAA